MAEAADTAPENLSTPEQLDNVAVEPASGYLSTAHTGEVCTWVLRV